MDRARLSEILADILSRSPAGVVVKVSTIGDAYASVGTLTAAEVADVRAALNPDPVQIAGAEGGD